MCGVATGKARLPLSRLVIYMSFLLFQFSAFNTEENYDEVQVWAGGKSEATAKMIARLTGPEGGRSLPVFHSPNNYMFVKHITDVDVQKTGFIAVWRESEHTFLQLYILSFQNLCLSTFFTCLQVPIIIFSNRYKLLSHCYSHVRVRCVSEP